MYSSTAHSSESNYIYAQLTESGGEWLYQKKQLCLWEFIAQTYSIWTGDTLLLFKGLEVCTEAENQLNIQYRAKAFTTCTDP